MKKCSSLLLLTTLLFSASAFALKPNNSDTQDTLDKYSRELPEYLSRNKIANYGTLAVCLKARASIFVVGGAKFICKGYKDTYSVTLKTHGQAGGSLTAQLGVIYFYSKLNKNSDKICYKGGTVGFSYLLGGTVIGMMEVACDGDVNQDNLGVYIDLSVGVGVAGELGYDEVTIEKM